MSGFNALKNKTDFLNEQTLSAGSSVAILMSLKTEAAGFRCTPQSMSSGQNAMVPGEKAGAHVESDAHVEILSRRRLQNTSILSPPQPK